MREVSPELATAVESPERRPRVRVSVDWDRDGHDTGIDDVSSRVASVTVERSLATDLPEPVRIVDGSAAATASVDLAGGDTLNERRTAAWYFSRLNAASPLAGKERLARPVTVDVGFDTANGVEWVRRFTGLSRALPVSSRDGTARLDAIDHRDRLRTPVRIGPIIGDVAGLNATWLVSYALAECGIHVSPPPRDGCRLWYPMHGSLTAMRRGQPSGGTVGQTQHRPGQLLQEMRPQFVPGPYLLGAHAHLIAEDDLSVMTLWSPLAPGPSLLAQDGTSGRLEMWVRGDPWDETVSWGEVAYVYLEPPQLYEGFQPFVRAGVWRDRTLFLTAADGYVEGTAYSSFALPTDGEWHFVGIAWDYVTATIRFRLDDVTEAWVTNPPLQTDRLPPTDAFADPLQRLIQSYIPIAEVQVSAVAIDAPWLNELPFTPGAAIDVSLLELKATLSSEPTEAWRLITELAAAEQARVGWNEDGDLFEYRARARLAAASAQTVQRELTAHTALVDLDYDDAIDQVRNIVSVGYTDIRIPGNRLPSNQTTVWSTSDVYHIPRGRQIRVFASYSNAVFVYGDIDDNVQVAPEDNSTSWITPNSAPDGTGMVPPAGAVPARLEMWDSDSALIVVTNHWDRDVWLANDFGAATIHLAGFTAEVGNGSVEVRNDASVQEFGAQPLDIPASRWVQSREVAAALAACLVGDLAFPHPTLTGVTIVGDPRLQLEDRVRIVDRDGIAIDGEYWITAITDNIDDGYTQQITARRAIDVGVWDVGVWDDCLWGIP